MKTFIGICMLVILASILTTMYARQLFIRIFKVQSERKYDMFIRWFIVGELFAMIACFYIFV